MVTVVGNELGNPSSNPGQHCLHSANTHGSGMNQNILPRFVGKL